MAASTVTPQVGKMLSSVVNETDIGAIADGYVHNLRTFGPLGTMLYSRDSYQEEVAAFLSCFSGATLRDEETVAVEDGPDAWRTSCRWCLEAMHSGDGLYGTATAKSVSICGITNARIHGNRVVEQWIEFDEQNLVRQLGISNHQAVALRQSPRPFPWPFALGGSDRTVGQLAPPSEPPLVSAARPGDTLVRRAMHQIWNRRLFGSVREHYSPSCRVHVPGGIECTGTQELAEYLLGTVAPFPDAVMQVDDVISDDAEDPSRVAIRWSLVGTHRHHGRFGPPSGSRMRITGISHQHLDRGVITEEWMHFGELAVMRRISRSRE